MGNGYAINAIIGKKIMKGAEKSFIVALFGPKIGSTAALKQLRK